MTGKTIFSTDPWNALKRIRDGKRGGALDILTGYLGVGASPALKALAVYPRIVIGLKSATQPMSQAQIDEIRRLQSWAEVRWYRGLHAKVYLFGNSAVAVGSANFTSGGFERLNEAMVVSELPTVVGAARKHFNQVWKNSRKVDPGKLKLLKTGTGGAEVGSIGYASKKRTTPFSEVPGKKGGSGPISRAPLDFGAKIRLCAYWPKWLAELNELNYLSSWSTGPATVPGDLQLFCITRNGEGSEDYGIDDQRLDAVHSLWRARTYAKRDSHGRWPIHAEFKLVCRFPHPIPKSDLLEAQIIKRRFPQSPNGVYIQVSTQLAKVLGARNPKLRSLLKRELLAIPALRK